MKHVLIITLTLMPLLSCGRDDVSLSSMKDNSEELRTKLEEKVLPFLNERRSTHKITTGKNHDIRYSYFQKPEYEKTILILPGFTEYIEKYAELIFDLYQSEFNVLILDHYGMGRSGRPLKNSKIVHIEQFEDYVNDATDLMNHLNIEHNLFLYGHSTGALIGAYLVARNPGRFVKAAYTSPLFKVRLGGGSRFFKKFYLNAIHLIRPNAYAPGYEDCEFSDYPFSGNRVTSSETRWDFIRTLEKKSPELWMCGPSTHWVIEILNATKKSSMEKVAVSHDVPTMVFMAKNDDYIFVDRVHDFVKWAPTATLRVFEQSKHEIYREVDAHRNIFLNGLKGFYEKK